MTNLSRATLESMSGSLGTQVAGLDLRKDLDPETVSALRALLLDRLVLLFPDQHLSGRCCSTSWSATGNGSAGRPPGAGASNGGNPNGVEYQSPGQAKRRPVVLIADPGMDRSDRSKHLSDATHL